MYVRVSLLTSTSINQSLLQLQLATCTTQLGHCCTYHTYQVDEFGRFRDTRMLKRTFGGIKPLLAGFSINFKFIVSLAHMFESCDHDLFGARPQAMHLLAYQVCRLPGIEPCELIISHTCESFSYSYNLVARNDVGELPERVLLFLIITI